jgi:hypothetical protein
MWVVRMRRRRVALVVHLAYVAQDVQSVEAAQKTLMTTTKRRWRKNSRAQVRVALGYDPDDPQNHVNQSTWARQSKCLKKKSTAQTIINIMNFNKALARTPRTIVHARKVVTLNLST